MKEASGEANMTVITIVLIGVVAAIATPLVNSLMTNAKKSSCCQANGGVWNNGMCYASCDTNNKGNKTCTGSVDSTCHDD